MDFVTVDKTEIDSLQSHIRNFLYICSDFIIIRTKDNNNAKIKY